MRLGPVSVSGPLVTIIVPSLNQGRFLLESLRSCLAQTYRPLEVLVVDGGSTDETLSILERISAAELRWTSEPDDGVADAVNRGLRRAAGALLAIHSADDVLLRDAIEGGVDLLLREP